jgi:hypothetical protein
MTVKLKAFTNPNFSTVASFTPERISQLLNKPYVLGPLGSASGSFIIKQKIKKFISSVLWPLYDFLSLKE